MKTIYMMMLATMMFTGCNVACAHPVMDDVTFEDCVSDMVLDWEDERCDQYRPSGDQERLAEVVIIYDPDEGTAKPIVVIGGD